MTLNLSGRTVARVDLSAADVARMFFLFSAHYERVTAENFQRDLNAKGWVILLQDETGIIQGFSTVAAYESVHQGLKVGVVYSGDTIIHPDYWGTPSLPRTWIQTVLKLSQGLPRPVYWLLISSGYKTYRFLPVFAKEFYPRYDRPTPREVEATMQHLARERFGGDYLPELGIVRFANGATPLRAGVADVGIERQRDPHVAFFMERNPGYGQGDELVCLTEFHPDNFTAAGRRLAR